MKIDVNLGSRSYPVHVEAGLLGRAAPLLRPLLRSGATRISVITDEAVAALHLPTLAAGLAPAGLTLDPIILPPGEAAKSWETLAHVCDTLLARRVERSDAILALGGGVIGDLVGFAAAILRRGCRFIQIPTTLLAQVDSSVGGKTAINTAAGKNLIGAFHQPALVLIDPDVLTTLPPRERMAGYAEVVKYGLIDDAAFFHWCEGHAAALLAGDSAAQTHAIATSVAAKARVVAADEHETADVRALLNLGHTFGHAFEAEAGYSDRLLHGEAVALGMAMAFRFSARAGLCPPQDAARVQAHLAGLGYRLHPQAFGITAAPARLVEHMAQDKKVQDGRLTFILARGIGQSFVARNIPAQDVEAFLREDI